MLRWAMDRALSIGYGVVYDSIVERFAPYRHLRAEVLALVEAAAAQAPERRAVSVLEAGCGPGNFTILLAEAGFTALGLEPYGTLVEIAREKRRARGLARLAFAQGDLAQGARLEAGTFDQVISIHTLYAHPDPAGFLAQACRVLRPGGHAVIVNHTRHMGVASTFAAVRARQGAGAALRTLGLWLLPNAIFEAARRRIGPHYWDETRFTAHVRAAGFTVLDTRRTFLDGSSLLVWARKDATA